MQKVNLLAAAQSCALAEYLPVGTLNGHSLNVLTAEHRTLDFHVHEGSDELFYVIEGRFWLETEEDCTEVNAGEIIIVPQGAQHRPIVRERSRFLLIELAGTLNQGNTGGSLR